MHIPVRQLPPPRLSSTGIPGQIVLEESRDAEGWITWMLVRAAHIQGLDQDLFHRAPGDGSPFGAGAFQQVVADIVERDLLDDFQEAALGASRLLRRRPPSRERSAADLTRLAVVHESRGRSRTALVCYEAAARLVPADPERSLGAGRAARNLGEWTRAERWFSRAVLMARRMQAWDCYCRALGSYGVMEYRRGRLGRARTYLNRALKRARRHGLDATRGMLAHDLISVEIRGGMYGRSRLPDAATRRAEAYAEEAFFAYGPLHRSIYALAHDTAQVLGLRGKWHEALPVFEATVERAPSDAIRALGWCGVAWAAAHLGRATRYREAMERVEAGRANGRLPAAAAMEASDAAMEMGELDRARRLIVWGLERAAEEGEAQSRLELEDQLQRLEERVDGTDATPEEALPRAWIQGLVGAVRDLDVRPVLLG